MWMISLGAGFRWTAVSLPNNTITCVLSSDLGLLWVWSSWGDWWCSQRTSRMLHSSRTSSTSSTSTPGLSTGEQSNNNTDVECASVSPSITLCVCVCQEGTKTCVILFTVGLIMHFESNSLFSTCTEKL